MPEAPNSAALLSVSQHVPMVSWGDQLLKEEKVICFIPLQVHPQVVSCSSIALPRASMKDSGERKLSYGQDFGQFTW